MLIMSIVMWYLCKHVPYYLVDHGNLIKNSVDHGRNNQYTLVHEDKNITLLPMTPDSILKDDINRANKAKQEKNKSENQIVAKEFEQQMKPNNKPSSVASEIKLKSACLLATKSDIDELDSSKSVCYAFVCKEAEFFEDVPSSLPLLSLTFCRSSLTSSHKTCHRDYHLFEGLSIKLT